MPKPSLKNESRIWEVWSGSVIGLKLQKWPLQAGLEQESYGLRESRQDVEELGIRAETRSPEGVGPKVSQVSW